MGNLAQVAFDYMWLILFGNDEMIDADYSVKLLEELPLVLAGFTPSEQEVLSSVGKMVKSRLLAEPDEYGYTPRDLVTDEQRRFLDAVINKEIYTEDWWSE